MESDEIDVPDVTAAEQSVPPPAVPVSHAGTDRLADIRLLFNSTPSPAPSPSAEEVTSPSVSHALAGTKNLENWRRQD